VKTHCSYVPRTSIVSGRLLSQGLLTAGLSARCLPSSSPGCVCLCLPVQHVQRKTVLSTDHAMLRRFVAGGFFKDVVGVTSVSFSTPRYSKSRMS
jgi:hypothetical protein